MISRTPTQRAPESTPARADETTWAPYEEAPVRSARALLLTVLYHPELRRVGETARLRGLDEDQACELSRVRPEFHADDGEPRGGLADRHLTRTPMLLLPERDGGVLLHGPGLAVVVDGRPLTGPRSLGPRELEGGVSLLLGGRVLLWLQAELEVPRAGLAQHEPQGDSAAVRALRAELRVVAGLRAPVLLRGESGTGKQAVARALHAASARAQRPFVALDLAALNPQTAVGELFGHRRGAFTGATRAHDGYFREADGGTIFLDEVGGAPAGIQAALLRVLETGEVQPVGGGSERVDVRVVAGTEQDLEAAALAGGFRMSLLQHLAGHELRLPPLRLRRADVPRLLLRRIRDELVRGGGEPALVGFEREAATRLPVSLVARLVRHDWPGNLRELDNVARRIVALGLAGRDPRECLAPGPGPAAPAGAEDRPGPARPARAAAPTGEALAAALARNHWKIDVTARELGISKTSLYALMARSPGLRKAGDIPRGELLRCQARHGGDLPGMAEELRVSLRALQLRLRELQQPGSGERA